MAGRSGFNFQDWWRAYFLEPSCGEGHMLDVLRQHRPNARIAGVEAHHERAMTAKAKGYRVRVGNFLEVPAQPDFDLVLMNPPFVGGHWKKHLEHALGFLKAGERWNEKGVLACILPASAKVDGHLDRMGIAHRWHDLPVASFKDSGTNVATGYIICHG